MKLSFSDYEAVAAEFLLRQGEVVLGDRCDELDRFSDATLADRLITQWGGHPGKPHFEQLVAAFGRLRAED